MSFPSNRIAQVRKSRDLSQQELADLVGAHSVTISNLERGKAHLTHEWLDRIAAALKVDWQALVVVEPPTPVFVEGWLEDHGLVRFAESAVSVDAKLGFANVVTASWLLIRDDTLYPAFSPGDLVRMVTIDDEDETEVAHCYGRLCLLQSQEDPQHNYIGYLSRGSGPRKVSLNRIGRPPITDVTLKSLHVIDRALYRPQLPDALLKTIEST